MFGLLILVVLLNWKYEVVVVNCFAENKSEQTFKVMTWNIDGSSPEILDNTSKISEKILKENADVVFIAEDYYECCDSFKSGKTKCARFEKRNVQKSGKTKRSKNFAHTTL